MRDTNRRKGSGPVSVEELWAALGRFISWLDDNGSASFDPYDLVGTRYGRWARRLYYNKHLLGPACNAPLILIEMLAPSLRSWFVRKERYATADAQLALAFMSLYRASGGSAEESSPYLRRATKLADELVAQSVPGYSGFCWGYPFDWQNVNGLMPRYTPHITATPYCYEAFVRLFDLTGDARYREIARSVAEFVDRDLNDTPSGPEAAAASYTPNDQSKVVNASAYRAFVLFDAGRRFDNPDYLAKAWKNMNFILQAQQQDGSWLYAIDNPPEAFIDNFHTCFVLKNLLKINQQEQSGDIRSALHRGYAYYRKALFDDHCVPRSFALAPRLQIVRLEMYNMAEAINLGALLRDEIPEAFQLAQTLAARLVRRYQLRQGYWVTRVYLGGLRHTFPYLRWPQAQLFHSLASLVLAMRGTAGVAESPAMVKTAQ